MKLCKDCKHMKKDPMDNMNCHRPREAFIDVVTGKDKSITPSCASERYSNWTYRCNEEGKFFEEKKTIWKRFVEFAMKPATNLGPM